MERGRAARDRLAEAVAALGNEIDRASSRLTGLRASQLGAQSRVAAIDAIEELHHGRLAAEFERIEQEVAEMTAHAEALREMGIG